LLTPSLAQAQVTRIVVPYPAGQLSDIIGRTVREALVRQGAGSAMVENIPGAGGAIGAQQFLNAAGGSYPLLLGSPNELILAPLSNAAVKYRAEDFRLVALVGTGPMVLVTRAELGASNADELIEAARRSSKSEPLSYGSVGVGSLYHLMGEQLARTTGTMLTHVPYKGGGPMLQDLAGGRLDFAMIPWSKPLQGLADQGKLRILGSIATSRPATLPNLPTVNEGRSLKDFAFDIWQGFVVQRDAPHAVRQRWHRQLTSALEEPAVRAALEAQGLLLSKSPSLEELDAYYRGEVTRYTRIAADIRLVPQ
jgi:tripartite-type tricarboxylate transporter receptor subunit TctC